MKRLARLVSLFKSPVVADTGQVVLHGGTAYLVQGDGLYQLPIKKVGRK